MRQMTLTWSAVLISWLWRDTSGILMRQFLLFGQLLIIATGTVCVAIRNSCMPCLKVIQILRPNENIYSPLYKTFQWDLAKFNGCLEYSSNGCPPCFFLFSLLYFTWINTAVLIKFFMLQMQQFFEVGAYMRVALIWKLDVTKNCMKYGTIFFHIKLTELTSGPWH